LHGFGLFDLYDMDTDDEKIKLGGTGKFGIMSNLHGWRQNGYIPGHMNAFSRALIGWLEPVPITQDGFYAIQPCELSSQIYVINKGFPAGEYLYIENRQPYKW
jgi:M6 family metalloprotease-like protein